MENYYDLFGVDKNVSKEVLHAIYKRLIKKVSNEDREKLDYAYSILSDPIKRAEYDELLKNKTQKCNSKQETSGVQTKKGGCFKFIIIILIIIAIIYTFKTCSNDETDIGENSTNSSVNEEGKKPLITKNYNIIDGTEFSDGVAFIECKNGEIFAIDTSGKKLFEVKGADEVSYFWKFTDGVWIYNDTMYNKKYDTIVSPKSHGYDEVQYTPDGSYVLVSKYLESYIGDQTLYGVINKKGEWEVELSEVGNWSSKTTKYSWDDGYVDTEEIPTNPYRFDECYIGKNENGLYLVNDNNEIMINLTTYNNPANFSYYNEHLLFEAYNENNVKYAFLLKKDGSFAIEPIRLHSTAKVGSLNNNGFVVENDFDLVEGKGFESGECFFVEYNGNIINYDDSIEYISFNNGLASVAIDNDFFVGTDDFYYVNYKGEIVIE